MNDLISIIVPVYNVEIYLKDCVESLINQTYRNIEIILINDGSTDNSLEILEEYKKKDTRIVIVNRENKGLLFSRVDGYRIAKGKYITFVDSDDWIEENAIEILYNNIREYDADVIKADYGYNNSKIPSGNLSNVDKKKFIIKENFEPEFYDMFLKDIKINSLCAQMFKRELLCNDIDRIDTTLTLGEDLEFNLQLYKNMKNILFISNVLYHYRYNPSSITRRFTEKNVKRNIISATKCYYSAYKNIANFEIRNTVEYKKAILTRLLDEVSKWQIDLIGVLNNKKKSIEYLQWYYFEYDIIREIMKENQVIEIDLTRLKYKYFYKQIFTNIDYAYLIGKIIYGIKNIYRKIRKQ